MAGLIATADIDVTVDHHLFGLCDSAADEDPPASPSRIGHPWLSAGMSMVYFEADEDIIKARVHFESWNGPPNPPDEADWPDCEEVVLFLPSGVLGVDQITAGSRSGVFSLPVPGSYRARLGWREGELDLMGRGEPEAFALAQFWPAEPE